MIDLDLDTLLAPYKCPYDYPYDFTQPRHINYFEVIIGKDGVVYDAPNGHQMGLLMMVARDQNKKPGQIENIADVWDYLPWLIYTSGAIPVWYEFCYGNPTEAQAKVLQQLVDEKYLSDKFKVRPIIVKEEWKNK